MLDTMRTLSKSIVSKLLMLLLVVSFGVWGVGDILKSSAGGSYAAKVGSATISMGEYQHQRQLLQRQLESMGIKGLPPGKLEMTTIRQLVTQKLTLLAIEDMGLFVNDETIAKSIAAMPEFQDEHGKFSKARYDFILQKQRLSEAAFLNDYKRDMAGKFLSDSLNMSDAIAPNSILTLEATGAGETRDVVLLTIPAADAADSGNEEAFKTYYEAHKQMDYMRPETRNLDYVVLTDEQVKALVSKSVTDEMLNQAATERKNSNKAALRAQLEKEQRDDVMHELSNTVEDELAAGKTIGEAFTKAGLRTEPHTMAAATTEMSKTSSDDITKTVVEQGFGLSEGEISHLITSKKGTLLMVSAKKVNAASPKPYEEVKADVKAHLSKELAADAARARAQGVKEALAKSANWQQVASEQKVSTRVVSHVGRAIEGHAPLNGIPPSLQQAIFEHNVNETAGPMPLSNGDQVLAFITASHVPQISAGEVRPSKEITQMGKQLGQNVEAHAYQAFSEKHHVEMNPAIMHPTNPSEE